MASTTITVPLTILALVHSSFAAPTPRHVPTSGLISSRQNAPTDGNNMYFLAAAIAVLFGCVAFVIYRRRRRLIARTNVANSRSALQRDIAALSNSFYGPERSRENSDGVSRPFTVADPLPPPRIRGPQRSRRNHRTRSTDTSHVDQDGLRLDVDESGEAPPPYMKQTGSSAYKAPTTRTRSVNSDHGTLVDPASPGVDPFMDVEMQDMNRESLPPGYVEVQRPEPARTRVGS